MVYVFVVWVRFITEVTMLMPYTLLPYKDALSPVDAFEVYELSGLGYCISVATVVPL